jgi:dTDP-4-amino-4,6-dideoxygalactose transaminase
VRTAAPETLAATLRERGVASGRHYPDAVHLTEAYAGLGHKPGAFPVAEALARECLSLPIFPGMTEPQVAAVVNAIRAHFNG